MHVIVRYAVLVAISAATAIAVAVSMRANYNFGYGFGQTPENAQVFAWANVAVDLWKATGLVVIVGLWKARRFSIACTWVPVWAAAVLWGLVNAVGVYAQDRAVLIGGREATVASYKDAERELEETEGKLKGLATNRSVGEIEAATAGVYARPIMLGERVRGTVGKISGNCTRDDKATAQGCLEVAELKRELAVAHEAVKLEAMQSRLREQVRSLRDRGGSRDADTTAQLLAWLTMGQLSVRDVQFGMPLFFAILKEMVSAFGPTGIAAYAESGPRAEAKADETFGAGVDESGEAHLARYVHDRVEPTDRSAMLDAELIHDDYETWCLDKGVDALTLKKFIAAFDGLRGTPALRGTIRKYGTRRYYGIRLVDTNVARLSVRS